MPAPRPPSDAAQLDLLGDKPAESREVHRLFLALVPDAPTRARLARIADTLKSSHPALRARWVHPDRYHATLHFLGDAPVLREDVVAAVKAAAGSLRGAPFAWTLDYAAGFHGRQPPCVLRGTQVPESLQQLWDDGRRALALAGLGGHLERSFTPHLTLGYSHGALLDATPIEPLVWTVDGIVLIHSVVGRPDYRVLARWPLSG